MRRSLLVSLVVVAGCLSGEGYIVIEAQGEGSDLPELPDPHGPDDMGDMDMGGDDAGAAMPMDAGPSMQLDSGPSMQTDSGAGSGSDDDEPDSGMDGMEMAWHPDAGSRR